MVRSTKDQLGVERGASGNSVRMKLKLNTNCIRAFG